MWTWDIVCLSVSNVSLSEAARRFLIVTAQDMIRKNAARRDVKKPGFEGRVTNTEKWEVLGSFGGVVFEAVIESDSGTGKVRYIVDPDVEIGGEDKLLAMPFQPWRAAGAAYN